MNLQWPENFACKDKDVHRDSPQITMNINADGHGTNSLVGTASNKNPARFPARAHFVSFNFTNNLICGIASSNSVHLPANERVRKLSKDPARPRGSGDPVLHTPWAELGSRFRGNERMWRFIHTLECGPHALSRFGVLACLVLQDP
jgi:hypothetical protein